MARFLVTGGAGFVGSHLVELLLEKQHKPIVLDNLTTGKLENLSAGVEFVRGDVCDVRLLTELMREVDGCFHLAAIASVQACNDEWVLSHQVNLTGTIAVFTASQKAHQRNPVPVVYASSSAIYGDNTNTPFAESAYPMPFSAYGADKRGCELHGKIAFSVHNVPTIGLRPFNIYGPRQDPSSVYSGVISRFADALQRQEPLHVYGDGEQTRDFIYVEDAVSYFWAAMQAPKKEGSVYNVCTGDAVRINQLARGMGKIFHCVPKIIYESARPSDIRHSCGNPFLAQKELRYVAKKDLISGLRELFQYHPI